MDIILANKHKEWLEIMHLWNNANGCNVVEKKL